MPVLYANNAASRLAASITNVATSFSVTAGHGARFPAISGGDYFYATLMDSAGNLEVVKVTARATDTFTVQRAQEGTTARAYAVNDIVELRITKLMLDDFKTDTRAGNATTATTLQTARTINGVSFNGSANITVADATKLPLAGGTMTGAITFAAGQTWPTFNQSTTGSAATLTTARTIGGVSFNGSANINLPGVNTAGNQNTSGTAAVSTAATVTTSATASAFKVPFANTTVSTTGNYGLLQDSEATFTYNPSTNTLAVGTVSGALSGNATTATTATNVSGGTANVTTLTVNSNNISAVNSLGFRNRIINGDMEINQRGAGAVLVTSASNGVKTVDRWFCAVSGTGGITFQQVVDGPTNGPKYSLKMTTTTAWTGTGQEGNHIFQWIENSNVLDFKYGTAQASSCAVSFWVKSSLTGSFSAFMYTNGGTANAPRTIMTPFTITAANTWEFKTITFVGDVTGAGYASIADNAPGLLFGIDLGSGTGRNTSTTNTWQQVDDVRTSSTPGILPTSGATMNLTGVQLEAGIVATPFERVDYGRKLFMCQRYYFNKFFSIFIATPAATSVAMLNYPAYMRAAPTTIGTAGYTSNVSYFTLDGQGQTNTRVVMGSTTGGAGEWTGFISAESEL
jgi:hypothetical protein